MCKADICSRWLSKCKGDMPVILVLQEEQPLIQDTSHLLTASARMTRTGSGPGLDLKSANSLCKADSIHTHCSLDSKLRSMQLLAGGL